MLFPFKGLIIYFDVLARSRAVFSRVRVPCRIFLLILHGTLKNAVNLRYRFLNHLTISDNSVKRERLLRYCLDKRVRGIPRHGNGNAKRRTSEQAR